MKSASKPRERDSAYVTFPTCNMVAEIDLQTGRVLQSRRFESDGQGGVTVSDTGISPSCPVECPTQFAAGVPADLPLIDPEGPFQIGGLGALVEAAVRSDRLVSFV